MGMRAVFRNRFRWSRRILNPFLEAPICLILQRLPSIVHAFIHVCNFQSMQCQKICVGHVRASIELCLKKGFSKATLGSSFTLNWEKKKYRSVRFKRHTAWFLIFQKRELKHRDDWSPQAIFWPYARSKKPDGLTAKVIWFCYSLPFRLTDLSTGAVIKDNQASVQNYRIQNGEMILLFLQPYWLCNNAPMNIPSTNKAKMMSFHFRFISICVDDLYCNVIKDPDCLPWNNPWWSPGMRHSHLQSMLYQMACTRSSIIRGPPWVVFK